MADDNLHPLNGLIRAIMDQESDFNPNAISPDGAVGIMQVMPEYVYDYGYGVPSLSVFAEEMGFDPGDESLQSAQNLLRDPILNERMGRAIFDGLLAEYDGDLRAVLTAYNMGAPAYASWVASGADPANLDDEAREYAPGVISNYERMYGQRPPETLLPEHRTLPQPRPRGLLAQ